MTPERKAEYDAIIEKHRAWFAARMKALMAKRPKG